MKPKNDFHPLSGYVLEGEYTLSECFNLLPSPSQRKMRELVRSAKRNEKRKTGSSKKEARKRELVRIAASGRLSPGITLSDDGAWLRGTNHLTQSPSVSLATTTFTPCQPENFFQSTHIHPPSCELCGRIGLTPRGKYLFCGMCEWYHLI